MAVPKVLLRPRRRRQCSSRRIWTPLTQSTSYACHLTGLASLYYDVCIRPQSTTLLSSTALYRVAKTTRLCMIRRHRTLKAPCLDPSDGFPARSNLLRTCSASLLLSPCCKGYLFSLFCGCQNVGLAHLAAINEIVSPCRNQAFRRVEDTLETNRDGSHIHRGDVPEAVGDMWTVTH